MRLSINDKEFEAISFAIDQIESALESSEDLEWNELALKHQKSLYTICEKFKTERTRAEELNEARRYVRSRSPWRPQAEIDKLARTVVKKKNELR
jgi:hypothetical protein